jgi:hypothetical protein
MRAAMSMRSPLLATLHTASAEYGQLVRSNKGKNVSGMNRVRDA